MSEWTKCCITAQSTECWFKAKPMQQKPQTETQNKCDRLTPEVIQPFYIIFQGAFWHILKAKYHILQIRNLEFDADVSIFPRSKFVSTEISENFPISHGLRLIMKYAFYLATQLLVGLMTITTSRGRCWGLSVTDCQSLLFGNFPHSQFGCADVILEENQTYKKWSFKSF